MKLHHYLAMGGFAATFAQAVMTLVLSRLSKAVERNPRDISVQQKARSKAVEILIWIAGAQALSLLINAIEGLAWDWTVTQLSLATFMLILAGLRTHLYNRRMKALQSTALDVL